MDPITSVEDVERNRAPPQQGSLFLHPSGCTDRIATYFNLPKESIASLSVTAATSQLYNAVLEYASMLPSYDQSVIKPLFISPLDPFEQVHQDDDTPSNELYNQDLQEMPEYGVPQPPAPPGHGVPQSQPQSENMKECQAPLLKFKLYIGESTITWPPPPNLTAEHLAKLKKMQRNRLSANRDGQNQPIPADEDQLMSDTHDMGKFMRSLHKRDMIYLVHYNLGESRSEFGGWPYVILMACPDPMKLRTFAQEIIQWRMEKVQVEPESTQYRLNRFKSEDGSGWWQEEGMKRARPPKSVILHQNQMEIIMDDTREFLSSQTRKWYIDHGLPHRRCYLFYGPPGTGKTSTVRAIASQFRLSCYFLNMTDSTFSNQMLADAFTGLPKNKALLVLEDVDALFNEKRKSEFSNSFTFSGLLNALDGFLSTDGVLTVMTTNHVDRLDEALMRAGRVDRRFFFGHPSRSQIENLFLTFFPDAASALPGRFADAVLERPKEEGAQSIATLQELFVTHRKSSAEDCINAVSSFFKRHYPGPNG